MSGFPTVRLRRMRQTQAIRSVVQETRFSVADLIYPMFVTHGRGVRAEVDSMPDVYQLSIDQLIPEIDEVAALGIGAVLLFGIPASKDAMGIGAYESDGIVQEATRAIRRAAPDMLVIADACLCEYTDHGHCGVIVDGQLDNDRTLELLAQTAVSQAEAGADVVAPSGMIDGQVGAIRTALDQAGFGDTGIVAYSAKYASAFYGPFRDAAGSTPQFGDRKTHQMDPPNVRQALREIELDIEEGADVVMVKPAMPYLDVIAKAKETFNVPVAAYNVSGEYAMVKAAAQNEWLDGQRAAMEVLTSIKRAGADLIISYHAKEAARLLAGGD